MTSLNYHLTVICVNLQLVFGNKVVENNCGTLTLVEPAVQHRPVTFTFVPSNQWEGANMIWARLKPGEWEIISNSTNVATYKNESVYVLRFSNSSEAENTEYKGNYVGSEVNGNWKYCRTSLIQLKLTVLKGCGMVYRRSPTVITDANVEIGYLPSMSVVNRLENYVRNWVFTPSTCVEAAVCARRNITGTYIETEIESNLEFVLTIKDMNISMNGMYAVECLTGNQQTKRSDGIMIQILAPPSQPMFMNTKDFDGCSQCLHGTAGTRININCNTTGGYKPLTVNISVAETRKRGKLTGGTYRTRRRFVNGDHMKEVKCEVSNKALTTPFTVVSKVYIMQQPQRPVLHINNSIDDQPYNVSCTCKGGRPSGNVTIRISGISVKSESVTQTNTYDSSGTFTSTTVLTAMQREWDGRKMKCCVSHETLDKMKCSKKASIRFNYAPLIRITVSTATTNVTEGTSVVLQCMAKSDPVSKIGWIKKDSNISITDHACGSNARCLNIPDIHLEDSGVYTCQADNHIFVSQTKDIEINVIEKVYERTTVSPQSYSENNAGLVVWPIVGAITVAFVFVVVGIVIQRIVQRCLTNPELPPHAPPQQGQSTPTPGPSTTRPPCGWNIEINDDIYDVIRCSGQYQAQVNPETSLVYEGQYLCPLNTNRTYRNSATRTPSRGCSYIDFNSKPTADIYETFHDNDQCRYPQPHTEISHDDDRYYLHPITREDDNTTNLKPEQGNHYMDLNTESRADAYVVTCDVGQCHPQARPETNQNLEGDSVNREEDNT